ncbi:MAG: hypothetical protein QW638_05455 [Candidatus Bathyarchaeia archaeon]|nr:hypothetical protein [Candidatus Bathyarchaeota archaeon]
MEDDMVMMRKISSPCSRKGQSRILEAVIAAAIIFIVFSVSSFLVRASDVRVLQERSDLDRLGYNVLHRLVESGAYGEIMARANSQPELAELLLKDALQRALPSSIYFNLTITECDGLTLTTLSINPSNTHGEPTPRQLEASSTSLIYTSKDGKIYLLILTLTREGGS